GRAGEVRAARYVALQLHVHRAPRAGPVEHLGERGDARAAGEPHADEIAHRQLRDLARLLAARHSPEIDVVEDDGLARGARPDVELERLRAQLDRAREGLERVLGRPALAPAAAVPHDDRAALARESGHRASSSAMSLASWRASSTLSAASEIAPTTGWPPPP